MDALLRIAEVRGFDAISVREVAEEAGVAPGLIHHHFSSMDDLMTAAFGSWADQELVEIEQTAPGMTPLDRLARTVVTTSAEQRLWHDALSASARHAALRRRAIELTDAYQHHVERMIRDGVAAGMFACADPPRSAWRLILLLDGVVGMVHVLGALQPSEVPELVSPVVEHELSLPAGAFAQALAAQSAASVAAP